MYTEFSQNLANVHMGSIVNAQNVDKFSQLEFNRSVTNTLKSMAKIVGAIRASAPAQFDNNHLFLSPPKAPSLEAAAARAQAAEVARVARAVGAEAAEVAQFQALIDDDNDYE
jgi:hypothetical protein